jgi:hypothetical protein
MFQPFESMVHLFVTEFSFLSGNCTDIFCYILKEVYLSYRICSTLIKTVLSSVGFKVTCLLCRCAEYSSMLKEEEPSVVPCSTLTSPHSEL